MLSIKVAANAGRIADGLVIEARHADTEADFYSVAEDKYKCSIAKCQQITKAK